MNADPDNEELLSNTRTSGDHRPPTTLGSLEKRTISQIDSLLQTLELLFFAQVSILYSNDNSAFLLLLRIISQSLFLSSERGQVKSTPPLTPTILANVVCIVSHLFSPNPSAVTLTTRNYLHGGILIDFVGELGPISKWKLLGLDLLVLLLQLLMLALILEKENVGQVKKTTGTEQDRDLEAGLLGSGISDRNASAETEEGIELRDINTGGTTRDEAEDSDSADYNYSAETILVRINVTENLKTLVQRPPTLDASSNVEEAGVMGRIISRIANARSQARGI